MRTLGLRGSELPCFCVLSLTQFYNPSVKNQRFLPAPFAQGSLGCSRTSASFENLHGCGAMWASPPASSEMAPVHIKIAHRRQCSPVRNHISLLFTVPTQPVHIHLTLIEDEVIVSTVQDVGGDREPGDCDRRESLERATPVTSVTGSQ